LERFQTTRIFRQKTIQGVNMSCDEEGIDKRLRKRYIWLKGTQTKMQKEIQETQGTIEGKEFI
jgi:hypothetical protein